jgi:outer membrane protein OmpA-like peptidoglycan-associated protein
MSRLSFEGIRSAHHIFPRSPCHSPSKNLPYFPFQKSGFDFMADAMFTPAFKTILIAILMSLLALPGRAQEAVIGVHDFVLSGDAVVIGDQCVRLTPAIDWSGGSAWYREAIDLSGSFQMEMEVMFGCDDVGGADGIVFAFTPYQGITGHQGEGMGFAGLRPSLGIEIDTWENEHLYDPPEDHIALLQHGFVHHGYNLKGPIVIPNVEDCNLHKLAIYWDHTRQVISVNLDGKEVLSYQDDIVQNIFRGESKLYWGVTAATGRYNNQHEICFRKLEFATPLTALRFHPREVKLLLRGNITPLDIAFDNGQHQLDERQYPELDKILQLLKENPHYEIDLDGYTDELGTAGANETLSLLRVQGIRQYLLGKGIASDRVHINGYGDKFPVDKSQPENAYRSNIRIDIRFFNPRT